PAPASGPRPRAATRATPISRPPAQDLRGAFEQALCTAPLAVDEPVADEEHDEHGELRAGERGSRKVLAEEIGPVDDDEAAEPPGILRAEPELPVAHDDLGLVADAPEARKPEREVLVLGQRVAAHVLVEPDLRRILSARAHETAAHELDVPPPVELAEIARIAVARERSLPAAARQQSTEDRTRPAASAALGLDHPPRGADDAGTAVRLGKAREMLP